MGPRKIHWPKSARATSQDQTAAPGPRPTKFGTSMAGPSRTRSLRSSTSWARAETCTASGRQGPRPRTGAA
eukprot:15445755-Alexandrium_andersonii.AAC.1